MTEEHIGYWESFYAGDARTKVPRDASGFAQWVAGREPVPGPLVDVGSEPAGTRSGSPARGTARWVSTSTPRPDVPGVPLGSARHEFGEHAWE
jgi:hypothetical protein